MGVLGLILARGGSKRVPNKNLRPLGGCPLVVWTAAAAQNAKYLDAVAVSSDSEDILTCTALPGIVPIRRPKELATDDASPYPAMLHALDVLRPFDHLCVLLPTSPFRNTTDIDRCVRIALDTGRPAVAAEEGKNVPNGAIYVGEVEWLRKRLLANPYSFPFDQYDLNRYYMPLSRSLDINTEEDFGCAESMLDVWDSEARRMVMAV